MLAISVKEVHTAPSTVAENVVSGTLGRFSASTEEGMTTFFQSQYTPAKWRYDASHRKGRWVLNSLPDNTYPFELPACLHDLPVETNIAFNRYFVEDQWLLLNWKARSGNIQLLVCHLTRFALRKNLNSQNLGTQCRTYHNSIIRIKIETDVIHQYKRAFNAVGQNTD